MNLPGFNAEAALSMGGANFRSANTFAFRGSGSEVMPQMVTVACGEYACTICVDGWCFPALGPTKPRVQYPY
jgi:hypothetical protein